MHIAYMHIAYMHIAYMYVCIESLNKHFKYHTLAAGSRIRRGFVKANYSKNENIVTDVKVGFSGWID